MIITLTADGKESLELTECIATIVVGEFDITGPRKEIESLKKWLEDYPIKDLVLDDNLTDDLGNEAYTLTLCFASIANDTTINILLC